MEDKNKYNAPLMQFYGLMKSGYWLWSETYKDVDGDMCAIYKCSNCLYKQTKRTNFCPNCGVKMIKE